MVLPLLRRCILRGRSSALRRRCVTATAVTAPVFQDGDPPCQSIRGFVRNKQPEDPEEEQENAADGDGQKRCPPGRAAAWGIKDFDHDASFLCASAEVDAVRLANRVASEGAVWRFPG